jgi:hypothetical protein
MFSDQNCVGISHSPMNATRSAHLTLLDLIAKIKHIWECKTMKLFIILFSPASYYVLPRIEIFVSAFHSVYIHLLMREPKYHVTNILTACSSLNLRDQVSDKNLTICGRSFAEHISKVRGQQWNFGYLVAKVSIITTEKSTVRLGVFYSVRQNLPHGEKWPTEYAIRQNTTDDRRQYMVASTKGLGPDKDCAGRSQKHLQKTDPSSRQRWRPQKQDRNCQKIINIWSRARDGARYQDLLTDQPSVAMWLWLDRRQTEIGRSHKWSFYFMWCSYSNLQSVIIVRSYEVLQLP